MGDPVQDADLWRDRSAINFADIVHAKLLIVHGANDPRCPVEQSRLFRDRLLELERSEGVDFEKSSSPTKATARRTSSKRFAPISSWRITCKGSCRG